MVHTATRVLLQALQGEHRFPRLPAEEGPEPQTVMQTAHVHMTLGMDS